MKPALASLLSEMLDGYANFLSDGDFRNFKMDNTPQNQEMMTMIDPCNESQVDFNKKKIVVPELVLARLCSLYLNRQSEQSE